MRQGFAAVAVAAFIATVLGPAAGGSSRPAGCVGAGDDPQEPRRQALPAPVILPSMLELETPHGRAHAHLQLAKTPRAALVLGHGAGGGVTAPDLVAATTAALAAAVSVVLVEQPYRVAGRRSPAPAAQLDAAWISVVEQLRAGELSGLPLLAGGRSSGARVACRTAAATGVVGVVCLAFPLRPPGRPDAPSRLDELDAVQVPVLVVQGERDPFGIPPPSRQRSVVLVPGNHSLRSAKQVTEAVQNWLSHLG